MRTTTRNQRTRERLHLELLAGRVRNDLRRVGGPVDHAGLRFGFGTDYLVLPAGLTSRTWVRGYFERAGLLRDFDEIRRTP